MSALHDLEVSRAFPARCIRLSHGGERLVLRPMLMTDAEEVAAAVDESLPELKPFMPWAHRPQTARSQIERLRSDEASYFAGRDMVMGLFAEGSGTMRTMVGLHPRVTLNPAALEIGYWAPTAHAGRGWTTLAVQVALVYAFDRLGADRVQVMSDEANAASRRVIEKCGFALEGRLRNPGGGAGAGRGWLSQQRLPGALRPLPGHLPRAALGRRAAIAADLREPGRSRDRVSVALFFSRA